MIAVIIIMVSVMVSVVVIAIPISIVVPPVLYAIPPGVIRAPAVFAFFIQRMTAAARLRAVLTARVDGPDPIVLLPSLCDADTSPDRPLARSGR